VIKDLLLARLAVQIYSPDKVMKNYIE